MYMHLHLSLSSTSAKPDYSAPSARPPSFLYRELDTRKISRLYLNYDTSMGGLMTVSAMVAIVIAALLAGGLWVIVRRAVGASAHRPPEGGVTSTASRADVALVYQSEAWASQAALAVGCGVAVLMWAWGTWRTQGYGPPISLAGSLGAVVGLAAYAVMPRKLWTSDPSTGAVADLTPRRPTSFARQWVFVLPTVAALILALGLLLTGLYSATDENGLHRVFQRRNLVGCGVTNGQVIDIQYNLTSTGPFPGWYYGVPVLISTVLMILAVYWSLSRTAAAPALRRLNCSTQIRCFEKCELLSSWRHRVRHLPSKLPGYPQSPGMSSALRTTTPFRRLTSWRRPG